MLQSKLDACLLKFDNGALEHPLISPTNTALRSTVQAKVLMVDLQ